MLTVKLEVMRPYRKHIQDFPIVNSDQSIVETTEIVNRFIKHILPLLEEQYPTATEFRWEYTQHGQGHYITNFGRGWLVC